MNKPVVFKNKFSGKLNKVMTFEQNGDIKFYKLELHAVFFSSALGKKKIDNRCLRIFNEIVNFFFKILQRCINSDHCCKNLLHINNLVV